MNFVFFLCFLQTNLYFSFKCRQKHQKRLKSCYFCASYLSRILLSVNGLLKAKVYTDAYTIEYPRELLMCCVYLHKCLIFIYWNAHKFILCRLNWMPKTSSFANIHLYLDSVDNSLHYPIHVHSTTMCSCWATKANHAIDKHTHTHTHSTNAYMRTSTLSVCECVQNVMYTLRCLLNCGKTQSN